MAQGEFECVKRLRRGSSKGGGKVSVKKGESDFGKFLKVLVLLEKGRGVTKGRDGFLWGGGVIILIYFFGGIEVLLLMCTIYWNNIVFLIDDFYS